MGKVSGLERNAPFIEAFFCVYLRLADETLKTFG